MRQGIFLTGGGGFVGQRLIPALGRAGHRIVALDRSGSIPVAAAPGLEIVRGDLLQPESYQEALSTCDVVLHLAAATGRASADDHFRVNARGTEALVKACRQAGVGKILFVSSIAVTFTDLRGYYYAQAKVRAEEAVRQSGLRFLIVRPAMIFGPNAPVLAGLEKLATLPVGVVPGNGRVQVQPIHVDDVVSCLLTAVRLDAFRNEAVNIGGADTVSIEDVLRRIRVARSGKPGPLLRVPLILLQPPLRLAEAMGLAKVLPLSAGQLSSFRFAGVGGPNWLQEATEPRPAGVDAMLEPAPATPLARTESPADLNAESAVFTRYLLGLDANEYVRTRYVAAHSALPALAASSRFDDVLVRFARKGPLFARLADGHSALFARSSLLRKKLVVLLAILESSPPFRQAIDAPVGGTPAPGILRLAGTGTVALIAIAAGSLVLLPLRVVLAVLPGARR